MLPRHQPGGAITGAGNCAPPRRGRAGGDGPGYLVERRHLLMSVADHKRLLPARSLRGCCISGEMLKASRTPLVTAELTMFTCPRCRS